MSDSTTRVSRSKQKPDKPYAGFPLFPHATGRWAKKIRGKLHYFGKWDDPQAALDRFNREWPYLSEGRTPPPSDTRAGVTVRDLVNAFLTSKASKLNAGELTERTFRDYFRSCEMLIGFLRKDRRVDDLRPDDFERLRSTMSERFGPVAMRNEITRVRMILKFAFDQGLIDAPVRYGQSFDRPSAKALRRSRNDAGPRMFEAEEVRRILDASDLVIRAMTLLGINCGFGNTDVASLPASAVDLDAGWIEFPRPKTEIFRRAPLWPETVAALRTAIDERPIAASADDDDLCFLTRTGQRWVRSQRKQGADTIVICDPLSQRFRRLLKSLKINGRRGLGFYTLRHVFETIGGESRDQVAVNAIMGHVDATMAGQYREQISDERLRAVTDTVHRWLFGNKK